MSKKRTEFLLLLVLVTLISFIVLSFVPKTDRYLVCKISVPSLEKFQSCSNFVGRSSTGETEINFSVNANILTRITSKVYLKGSSVDQYSRRTVVEVQRIDPIGGFRDSAQIMVTIPAQGVSPIFLKYRTGVENVVQVRITNAQTIQVFMNGEKKFGFRWNKKIFEEVTPSSFRIVADTDESTFGTDFSLFFLNSNAYKWAVITLIVLIGLLFLSWHKKCPTHTRTESSNEEIRYKYFRIVCKVSLLITFSSVVLGKLGIYGKHWYYSRDGLTFANAPRFSDWFQIAEISSYDSPYLQGQSNYPPAGLALFKICSFLGTIEGFLTVSISVIATVAAVLGWNICLPPFKKLLLGIVCTVLSYPFIFSFDRGATDLFVALLFILFVQLLRKEKLKVAALILGLMIAFKVYPIIFVLIFFFKKKYGNFLIAMLTAGLATSLSSIVITGTPLTAVVQFIDQNRTGANVFVGNPNIACRSTSASSWTYALKAWNTSYLNLDEVTRSTSIIVIVLVLLVSLLVVIVIRKPNTSDETKLLSLTILMLIVIPVSNDYRLLLLIVAFSFWLKETPTSNIKKSTLVLFGVMFSSHPLKYMADSCFTLGSLASFPLLLLILFQIVLASTVKLESRRILDSEEQLPKPSLKGLPE